MDREVSLEIARCLSRWCSVFRDGVVWFEMVWCDSRWCGVVRDGVVWFER